MMHVQCTYVQPRAFMTVPAGVPRPLNWFRFAVEGKGKGLKEGYKIKVGKELKEGGE